MTKETKVIRILDGDVTARVEQGAVHLRAIDGRDPVELTSEMARELAAALVKLAEQADRE